MRSGKSVSSDRPTGGIHPFSWAGAESENHDLAAVGRHGSQCELPFPAAGAASMTNADTPEAATTNSIAYRRQFLVPARARPGMRLLADVRVSNGAILLPAGTLLDDRAVQRLIQRSIEFILVAVPDDRSPTQQAQDVQAAELRLEHIFRGASTPARNLLRDSVSTYRRTCAMPCQPDA